MKTIIKLSYYQFLMGVRLKQSMFFSLVFPVFIFILFNMLWNTEKDKEVAFFLLTGIVGANTVSEGVYAISAVIKNYVTTGFFHYLQKIYSNRATFLHFIALIISRVFNFVIIVFIMVLAAKIIVGVSFQWVEIARIFLVLPLAIFIFSFLGLVFAFIGIRQVETSVNHFLFYLIVFSSDAYYFASKSNAFISFLGNFFPLNAILNLLRDYTTNYVNLFLWVLIPPMVFYFLFTKTKIKRS
ncbi:MAG: hypothetical protein K2Q03_01270 [Sphingobacteriaceae bacterium]|nr:hypothetical protein [Sphingobacteriaceae bacterium]